MVRKNLLRSKLAEKELTYSDCAVALDIATTSFSNKMNGHIAFSIKQATTLSSYLELTVTEMTYIFLT